MSRRLWIVGGEDVHLRVPLISKLRERGFDITIVGSCTHASIKSAGIPFLWYPLERRISPLQDRRALQHLTTLFREGKPDIIHAFDTKPAILAMIAGARAGIPARLRTITGMGHVFSSNSPLAMVLRVVYRQMQRRASRLANMTVFQNRDDQAYFCNHGMTIAGQQTLIPGSGVNVEEVQSKVPNADSLLELRRQVADADEQIVIMISRMDRAKGVLEFLEAGRILSKEGRKIKFLLVGPQEATGRRRVTIQEIERYAPVVKYVGARNDVPALLAISDIAVLPSYYREGVPRVLLEAGALGLPLITTDMPGCRDVVENEVNGMLVPCRDSVQLAAAVRRLLLSPEERRKMGAISRERVQNQFHLNRVTDAYVEIYDQLSPCPTSNPGFAISEAVCQ